MIQNNDKYHINIKTIQATIFKQVIDALKDILMDVNLEIDETGVKIIAMDNTHVVLIHLKLEADKFEEYYCEKKRYIGVNMLKLHMLIKTIGTNDLLNLYIEKETTEVIDKVLGGILYSLYRIHITNLFR